MCNTIRSADPCEESFNMTFYKPSRFIRVTQTKGECGSAGGNYFGLSAIDFYNLNNIKTCSCKHWPINCYFNNK